MQQIKKLTVKDYKQIFALSEYAFQYKLAEEELEQKKRDLEDHTVFAWMEDGQIAGKTHIIPLISYINGKEFKMGGISSVATWPEYRRKGIIKNLLYKALIEMKENGQLISFLSPFSFSFYRRYGWEFTFSNKHYNIPTERLKKNWDVKGYVRRISKDIQLLHEIYISYAKNYTGMLKRSDRWWENRILKDKDMSIAVAYNEASEAEGYMIYEVKNEILTIKEMVYLTLNGWKLLLEFIANHDSMAKRVELRVPENDQLSLMLDEPRFNQEVYPYFMARIVDVYQFLKNYPFSRSDKQVNILLRVKDEFFAENSGIYKLDIKEGKAEVTYMKDIEQDKGIDCTIQQLTSLLLGFQRPETLNSLGLITGDETEIEKLDQMVPKQQTFFLDYF